MKKIFIVGFGGMGKAHLNLLKFIEKKFEILIFDRFLSMRELIKKILRNLSRNQSIKL